MQYDWSDSWLQQAAGWKAVKEGIALHARGLIQNARLNEEGCQGVFVGTKTRRVKVVRLNASLAEAFCGCAENQRSGSICEHAVAVILSARESQSHPSATVLAVETENHAMTKQAYRIRFFPSWNKEWQQGRLTAMIEKSDRPSDEFDVDFHEWLLMQGVAKKSCPLTLSLHGVALDSFLRAIIGHNEIICDKQTIVFHAAYPKLVVRSQAEDGHWIFFIDELSGHFLGGKLGPWLKINEHLFEIEEGDDRGYLYQIITEKRLKITYNQYFSSIFLRQSFVPSSNEDTLAGLDFVAVAPMWKFHVDGSLRQLRLSIQKIYQVEERSYTALMNDDPGFLCQLSNKCFYSAPGKEQIVRDALLRDGWHWHEDRKEWQLRDESKILDFLVEGEGSPEGEWCLSSQLSNIRGGMVLVKPTLEVSRASPDASRIRLGFTTEGGKPLDADKIRALLQSGKRLIQTNDGNSLLLPRDSWEVFERSVRDLKLEQKKGEYLASRHQEIAIEYLRKYIDKTNKSNELSEAIPLVFPVLNASLREYQLRGVNWLHDRLTRYGFGLLADEMGLGKTLQTIALLSLLASLEHPALVVVPTSLLSNWLLEVERFAPELNVLVIHGPNRDSLHATKEHHVIVTSYGILMNDRALFMKREYSVMVLDEASAIRNPDTEVARCVFRMNARAKLALTGTPLENHLRDLWSIFQFLQPGYLGDRKAFRENYESIESISAPVLQSLRIRVMPFMLRRTKEEVAKDLPAKIETDDWCELSPDQSKLYQSVWEEGLAKVESLCQESESAARMSLLTVLLRLRQICCDAALVAPELAQSWSLEQRSRKMERLFEILRGAIDSGRKMLVFSQFAQQLKLIERECDAVGVKTLILDGSTRNRQEIVDKFQRADGPSMFLISLKAGGYGLNLTRASTVVHFDPWWNPAAERQASDRAHRIGQTQTVNVYRLLTRGTVEERVIKLQQGKSMLAEQLFSDLPGIHSGVLPSLSQLHELLRYRVSSTA